MYEKSNNFNVRENYVDVAKAIAIFLVILGHSRMLPAKLIQWIYAFHMPLFFVCYGITYNIELHKNRGFLSKKFFLERFKRLYIPFIFWALIYSALTPQNLILNIYASHETLSMSSSLTSLWFLACMFVATIMFELICMIAYNTKYYLMTEGIICLVLFMIGGLLLPRFKYGYPLCTDVAFVAILFIASGHLLFQKFCKWLKGRGLLPQILIAIGSAFTSVVLALINLPFLSGNNVEMASRDYGQLGLFYFTAISASLSILCFSLLISEMCSSKITTMFTNVGRSTLGIMVLHKPIIQMISKGINSIFHSQPLIVGIIGVFASTAICCLCYFITKMFSKYLPSFVGEMK